VDLGLALAALSPARGGTGGTGTQTPRSGSQSARHSRTEETLQVRFIGFLERDCIQSRRSFGALFLFGYT